MERDSGLKRLGSDVQSLLRRFFAEAPNALRHHLNVDELARIVITAVTAGGGTYGVLEALLLSVGTLFPAPTDAALAASGLAFALEMHRRLNQGKDVPPGALRSSGASGRFAGGSRPSTTPEGPPGRPARRG